jgi:hypothetical protein
MRPSSHPQDAYGVVGRHRLKEGKHHRVLGIIYVSIPPSNTNLLRIYTMLAWWQIATSLVLLSL